MITLENKITYLLLVTVFMWPLAFSFALTGCLLTIILLMRALDPLGYEKETLAHFQTLKVSITCIPLSLWHWQDWLKALSPLGSGFHALCLLQWPVQQVYDWKHHPENGVRWSARLQHFWQGWSGVTTRNHETWTICLLIREVLKNDICFSGQQNLTTLCHLDQLLLVTHISLSSNQLQRLPPQFAMLQCLEVIKPHIRSSSHTDVVCFPCIVCSTD